MHGDNIKVKWISNRVYVCSTGNARFRAKSHIAQKETIEKLRSKVATLKQKLNRAKKKKIAVVDKNDRMAKEALFKLCEENLSIEMADIVRLSLSALKRRGLRYSKEVTAMSNGIYNIAPKCCKHLRNFVAF